MEVVCLSCVGQGCFEKFMKHCYVEEGVTVEGAKYTKGEGWRERRVRVGGGDDEDSGVR